MLFVEIDFILVLGHAGLCVGTGTAGAGVAQGAGDGAGWAEAGGGA